MMEYVDRDLDQFIAQNIMGDMGTRNYTTSMGEVWRLVEKMIQKHHVELKLDMFLYQVAVKRWHRLSSLCRRRLKPAATINCL